MMRDQNKCVMTLEMPRVIYWVEIVPYWKESLSGIQKLRSLTRPWMCVNSEMSAVDRQRIKPVYWSLVNEGFIWNAAVFNYMVIYWSETIYVCLQHVKMNSEDKKESVSEIGRWRIALDLSGNLRLEEEYPGVEKRKKKWSRSAFAIKLPNKELSSGI